MKRAAILAVDAGGSKVDAALLAATGEVLGASRSTRGGRRHDAPAQDGEDPIMPVVATAIDAARAEARLGDGDGPVASVGIFCMAGADFPADERRLRGQLRRRGWAGEEVVLNDTFAVLRAGSERGWGVAVVCGYGINCAGVAPDGRTFRFPAIGTVSGDWGGGGEIGPLAMWYAARAEDGRGEPTALAELVPVHFRMRRPYQVMQAIHFGRLEERRLYELPPVVFRAARGGDRIARDIVDRQADEIVTMASTAIRRLRLRRTDVEVVLGGGIFRSGDRAFLDRIAHGIRASAPSATIVPIDAPPVLGAALLGLERLEAAPRALGRARRALTDGRFRPEAVGRRRGRR